METYKGVPYCQVALLNDDKSLCLNIGFLGYTYDDVEKYLNSHFVECGKGYAQRWTQMKYITLDGEELS